MALFNVSPNKNEPAILHAAAYDIKLYNEHIKPQNATQNTKQAAGWYHRTKLAFYRK